MDTKTLALLLAVLGALSVVYNQTQTKPEVSDFEAWKLKFGISYESMFENAYRERIFLENIAKIEAHNSNKENTYKMGVNQFSAITQDEFVEMYLGTIVPTEMIVEDNIEEITPLGEAIDWRDSGAVTAIKNQGQCGSCWAFSTTGALEGLSKIGYGTLQSFSEQQLVDCSGSYGNQACNGGLMDNAFKYVKDHGIVHEEEYAYKAVKQTCKNNSGPFKISGFTDVKTCATLITAVKDRPVSIAVDATNWSPYKSGVFSNCKTSLNHGVLLVGIDSNQNWIVKNSWGTSWGQSGYITLKGVDTKGSPSNTCGLCNVASYPNK